MKPTILKGKTDNVFSDTKCLVYKWEKKRYFSVGTEEIPMVPVKCLLYKLHHWTNTTTRNHLNKHMAIKATHTFIIIHFHTSLYTLSKSLNIALIGP